MNRIHQNLINSPSPGQQDDHIHPKCQIRQQSGCPVQHGKGLTDSVPVFVWRCGGSLLVHQTSEAEVPGSHPDHCERCPLTMILMRCRIIANNVENSQGSEGNLPLRQKKILKTKTNRYLFKQTLQLGYICVREHTFTFLWHCSQFPDPSWRRWTSRWCGRMRWWTAWPSTTGRGTRPAPHT